MVMSTTGPLETPPPPQLYHLAALLGHRLRQTGESGITVVQLTPMRLPCPNPMKGQRPGAHPPEPQGKAVSGFAVPSTDWQVTPLTPFRAKLPSLEPSSLTTKPRSSWSRESDTATRLPAVNSADMWIEMASTLPLACPVGRTSRMVDPFDSRPESSRTKASPPKVHVDPPDFPTFTPKQQKG